MEHVHDYRAAIRELYRVAKPGAKVAITIPISAVAIASITLRTAGKAGPRIPFLSRRARRTPTAATSDREYPAARRRKG